MSAIINGSSPSVTFSDGTTQATSAIVSGYVPYANLPAGSVLQVVQGTTINQISVSAGTGYTASNLTASITPKFSTSKIFVIYTGNIYIDSTNGEPHLTIYRNGTTNLAVNAAGGFSDHFSGGARFIAGCAGSYLDSPATTSSTSYTVYMSNATAGVAYFPPNSTTGTITLMEIAA